MCKNNLYFEERIRYLCLQSFIHMQDTTKRFEVKFKMNVLAAG